MTQDTAFRCVPLDQVVDPETFRRDLVSAYFGGLIPSSSANQSDDEIGVEATE